MDSRQRLSDLASESASLPATRSARWLTVPLLLGALVALTVGLLARKEAVAPGSYPGGYFRLFFSDSLHLKVWLATAALALALTQLFMAVWIFEDAVVGDGQRAEECEPSDPAMDGRNPGRPPSSAAILPAAAGSES